MFYFSWLIELIKCLFKVSLVFLFEKHPQKIPVALGREMLSHFEGLYAGVGILFASKRGINLI